MSTSRGQCCQVCVTTRSYSDRGKNLWNRDFGTDTVDMYVYSGDSYLIGNDELIFSYLDEFIITDSGNQQEKYVLPTLSHIFNYSNFGSYHQDGKFASRQSFDEFDSDKTLPYIQSYEFHQNMSGSPTPLAQITSNYYSYPLGTNSYNRCGNTKTARLFVNESGVNIVQPNNIYHYEKTGTHHNLKHIAHIGQSYNLTSFEDNKIYCGGEKYCHGVIELLERFQYISGTPDPTSRERINIIYNYEPNESGILFGSGIIGSCTFRYFNIQEEYDEFDFSFYKDSGLIWLGVDTPSCGYKAFEAIPQDIYRGKFELIHYDIEDGLPDDGFPSWLHTHYPHFNHHFYKNPTTICDSGTDLAWKINDYVVDTTNGKIKIELEKIYNFDIDSGAYYYRYNTSVFDGFDYRVSGTGLINGFWSYYSPELKRSEIVQFNTNTFNVNDLIYKSKDLINSRNSNFVLNSEWDNSGTIFNNGTHYGYWNLGNFQQHEYLQDKLFNISSNFIAITSGNFTLDDCRASGYYTVRKPYFLGRNGYRASIISGICPGIPTGTLFYTCPVPWLSSGYEAGDVRPPIDGYSFYKTIHISQVDFAFNVGEIHLTSGYFPNLADENGNYPGWWFYEIILPGTGVCNQITWSYTGSGYSDVYVPTELLSSSPNINYSMCLTDHVNSGDTAMSTEACCMQTCFGENCYYYCRLPIIYQYGDWYSSCSGYLPTYEVIDFGFSSCRREPIPGSFPLVYPMQLFSLNDSLYFLPQGTYPTADSGLAIINRYGNWGSNFPDITYATNNKAVHGLSKTNNFIGYYKNNIVNLINKDINYD